MSDLFDDRDDDFDELQQTEEGASLVGGGGPASTLNDDAEMDDADFHGDRLGRPRRRRLTDREAAPHAAAATAASLRVAA